MTREDAKKVGEILTETLSRTFGLTDAQLEERERSERKRLKEAKKLRKAEKKMCEAEDRVMAELCGTPLRVRG